jgi:hypothetical protein
MRLSLMAILFAASAAAQGQSHDMTFFVTSVGKGNGADLGGVEGADAHCNALAKAAGSKHTNWRPTSVPGSRAATPA